MPGCNWALYRRSAMAVPFKPDQLWPRCIRSLDRYSRAPDAAQRDKRVYARLRRAMAMRCRAGAYKTEVWIPPLRSSARAPSASTVCCFSGDGMMHWISQHKRGVRTKLSPCEPVHIGFLRLDLRSPGTPQRRRARPFFCPRDVRDRLQLAKPRSRPANIAIASKATNMPG